MGSGAHRYIWQADDWPNWRCDLAVLAASLAEASRAQGTWVGRLADVGLLAQSEASLVALTADVVRPSEIEGGKLSGDTVRPSSARRLGEDIGALAPVDRHAEGFVEMVLDATSNCHMEVNR